VHDGRAGVQGNAIRVGGDKLAVSIRERDTAGPSLFVAELVAARTAAGLSQDALAAQIHYSPSLIGMIESGRRAPTLDVAQRLDTALKAPGTLARLQQHDRATPFPSWFRPYADAESTATELRSWQSAVIDGLLQTPDYARALLSVRLGTSDDAVEQQVAARLARQDILSRPDPPLVWVILDECVLRRPVGGPSVMLAQVEHLITLAESRTVVVQILPTSVGSHDGLNGSFIIADFADAPGIVYLETALTGMIIESREQVAAVRISYDGLRTEALPRVASTQLLKDVAKEQWT
jgi:transcriptional regulator with XRE-family HTH domain